MEILFLKHKNNFKKGNSSVRPDLYWHLILYVGVWLTFASFIFGFYVFRQVNIESVSSVGAINSSIETVKKERIDKVLEYFSIREKKSIKIINSPSPIIDPSL